MSSKRSCAEIPDVHRRLWVEAGWEAPWFHGYTNKEQSPLISATGVASDRYRHTNFLFLAPSFLACGKSTSGQLSREQPSLILTVDNVFECPWITSGIAVLARSNEAVGALPASP